MTGAWWDDDGIGRFIADLVRGEVTRLRPSASFGDAFAGAWCRTMRLDEAGLGLDSLERLEVAAALSETLNMQVAGLEDRLLARPEFGSWCDVAVRSLERHSATVTMRTSGSTGVPRPFTHALGQLEREVESWIEILGERPRRILSAVPCHHIYGFIFSLLLPSRLPRCPVVDVRGLSPAALLAAVEPGDLVIGFPVWWQAVVRGTEGCAWPGGVTGVTSTGPCPAEIGDGLRTGGLSRLIEIHGSTETAGLGWRDDPREPYRLLPHWTRSDAATLRLRDGHGGPGIAAPDALSWIDAQHYRVGGRQDGAVQVGGTNVFPARIAAMLGDHDAVRAASVRLMQPHEGVRLKAFVVPRQADADVVMLRLSLEAFAARMLTAAERPRAWTFGAALPVGPLGKAADWPAGAAISVDRDRAGVGELRSVEGQPGLG